MQTKFDDIEELEAENLCDLDKLEERLGRIKRLYETAIAVGERNEERMRAAEIKARDLEEAVTSKNLTS